MPAQTSQVGNPTAVTAGEEPDGGESGRPRRRVVRAMLACAAAALLAAPAPSGERPTELTIASDVRARLEVLAGGLQREIVLCLLGRTHGRTAYATDFFMPVPHASTPNQVVTGPCPRGTVATWHNHPSARGGDGSASVLAAHPSSRAAGSASVHSSSGPVRTDGEGSAGRPADGWGTAGAAESCRPSRRDVSTALRLRIPFLVIADGAGRHCIHPLERLEALDG